MREVKFRALVRIKRQITWNWEYYTTFSLPIWLDSQFAEIKVKDLQFTGLKDKNGKEIYEGDILKCIWHDKDQAPNFWIKESLAVGWGEKEGAWVMDSKKGTGKYLGLAMSKTPYDGEVTNTFEIIGNIYENPELLEQTTQAE